MNANVISTTDRRAAMRELRTRKRAAFMFVLPILAFLMFTFVAPIATMLFRSVHHPIVAELIPDTLQTLDGWDNTALPSDAMLAQMALDLGRLAKDRTAGKLGQEINRILPGFSSIINSTARRLGRIEEAELAASGAEILVDLNARWAEPETWRAIQSSGDVYTSNYYLTALDLERRADGGIQTREDTQIYVQLYSKTLWTALIITGLTVLLGYPLAYYMANAPAKHANMLMVFVLLPFWTSLLVRTTSWIAMLQTNGVVNSMLMAVGITDAPLELLYTQFATILAMTHILLPFMILPLFSVMKGIDPSFLRAALSMGARPIPAFIRVYLPMTLPGLSAGALLVFIISVGYYITPALVGGTDGQMISNIIAFHMQQSNNWELAAALGSLLLGMILILYWLYDRFVGAGNIKLG
ncbi:ABC transporter permease [Ascidiaceihabitans sp.]|uniref:ABC transporter permease n=1 Tax=Ascidiaceihabitans sp. TaxID=1872644 RepID=UPI0032996769